MINISTDNNRDELALGSLGHIELLALAGTNLCFKL